LNVQVATSFARKTAPKVFHHLYVQLANLLAEFWHAIDQKCPAAQIHNGSYQRLIHRYVRRAKSDNSTLVPECFGKCQPKRYRDVFNRMMLINVQITLASEVEVE